MARKTGDRSVVARERTDGCLGAQPQLIISRNTCDGSEVAQQRADGFLGAQPSITTDGCLMVVW